MDKLRLRIMKKNIESVMPHSSEVYNMKTSSCRRQICRAQCPTHYQYRYSRELSQDPRRQHTLLRLFDPSSLRPLSDERNMEIDGKATAWKDSHSDGSYASSWIFHKGSWYSYELKSEPFLQFPQAFLEDYERGLEEAVIGDVVGLQVYIQAGLLGFR